MDEVSYNRTQDVEMMDVFYDACQQARLYNNQVWNDQAAWTHQQLGEMAKKRKDIRSRILSGKGIVDFAKI